MCRFASFVLTVDKEFWSEKSESHSEIIKEFDLHEMGTLGPNVLNVELIPVSSLVDLRGWQYHVDQDRIPSWIRGDEEARTRQAASRRFAGKDLSKLSAVGCLDLSRLTSLPANGQIRAGWGLDLSRLTSLPANAKLSAGGGLDLRSLTSLPANGQIRAGGYIHLTSLKGEIPKGVVIEGIIIR